MKRDRENLYLASSREEYAEHEVTLPTRFAKAVSTAHDTQLCEESRAGRRAEDPSNVVPKKG